MNESNIIFEPVELPDDDAGYSSSSRATTPSNFEEEQRNDELDDVRDQMRELVKDLRVAAGMIEQQLDVDSDGTWLKSLARRRIGQEISDLVADVQKLTTGHKRKTVWGSGSRSESKRVANTLGYQIVAAGGKEGWGNTTSASSP
ncbi:hypothetical protein V5O48_013550 [Marasmius crinis-equi]|uniref:Uncharacterized protein n=1 Tax=Marasmius crinis-equi TaxID=585013 RepID=A0ABR3EZR7_9AGAR